MVLAALLVVCLATVIIIVAINNSRRIAKAPTDTGNPFPAEGAYQVAFSDETVAGDLIIRLQPSVADNGSLVYQVLGPPRQASGGRRALLGAFNYIPWQEHNPLFRELPGGDLILGSRSLYLRSDQKIHDLGEGAGLGHILDYSVNDSDLALAGKSSQESDTRIYIYVRGLAGNAWTQVDSFSYPDYLGERQAYLCWAGGKLYYDCWQDNRPVVKAYEPASNQASVFKDNAMNPQASPDGRYLAMFASDAPSGKKGYGMGLELLDLESGRVSGLEGLSRLFWSPGYVTTWDSELLELHVYELSSGAKVKDVPADGPVADLIIDNGILRGAKYNFDNRQIAREQFQIDLANPQNVANQPAP
jgi:hypothetical protein